MKRRGHTDFSAENMRIIGGCLYALGSSVGWSFCVMFHSRFTIDRSALTVSAWKFSRTDMPCGRLVQREMGKD